MKFLRQLFAVVLTGSIFFAVSVSESIATDTVFAKPEYRLKVTNQVLTAPNRFEFEIRIRHTNPDQTPFNYAGAQYFFDFNPAIANGGTLSYAYSGPDTSDLPVNFRPRSPSISGSQLRLAVNTFPGPGNGYLIPTSNPDGIKVIRMAITTTAASFTPQISVGLQWRDSLPNPYTKVFAYTLKNSAVNTEITNRAWHSIDIFPCVATWTNPMVIRDAGNVNDTLKFGMSPAGTNGLDTCLGEVLVPPPPPIGVFDCRFILPNNDAVKTDFRKDTVQNVTWRMSFQPSVSGYPITFTWNNQSLPATGTFFLRDEITGTIVNVNMRSQTSYTLTNAGITSLKIEYLYNQTLSGSVSPGWNIVSVPLRTSDMLYTALFPGVASEAYTYSGGYVSISMLSNGTGYWMRFNNNTNYNFTGYPWSPENMIVSPGWNLIGPFDENIPVNTILSNPAGIVSSSYFGYSGGYFNPDTLKVGKGYWIRTTMAGYLYKGATDNQPATAENPLEKFVKLSLSGGEEISASLYLGKAEEINSDYSLPPVPPQGIFDARFGTDKMVEVLGQNHQIRITPSQKEIVLSVGNAKGMKFRVKDEIDGTILNKELTEESQVTVPANLSSVMLEMLDALPLTYELSQNFPNPFNPATVIRYQVPNDGVVKIVVYDVLGREVKQLVNGFRSAGKYETRFDAGSLSSGVYFYRMKAGSFDVIRKMMVVK